MTQAYIGLGSNLNHPVMQLKQALQSLATIPQTVLSQVSPFYCSKAVGYEDQPDFVNAVACCDTELPVYVFFKALQTIEKAQGRIRGRERNGPRTLDLDLLLYGQCEMQSEILTLPHPRLEQRAFVIVPLMAIAPQLYLNDGRSIQTLYDQLSRQPRDVYEIETETL